MPFQVLALQKCLKSVAVMVRNSCYFNQFQHVGTCHLTHLQLFGMNKGVILVHTNPERTLQAGVLSGCVLFANAGRHECAQYSYGSASGRLHCRASNLHSLLPPCQRVPKSVDHSLKLDQHCRQEARKLGQNVKGA